jgi:hypothetical protein
MKLAQPTSAVGSPGQFYSRDTGEEYPELSLVPIKIQATRTLWPEGFGRDRLPECASMDGIQAIETFSDGSRPLYPRTRLYYVSLF